MTDFNEEEYEVTNQSNQNNTKADVFSQNFNKNQTSFSKTGDKEGNEFFKMLNNPSGNDTLTSVSLLDITE